MYKPSGKITRSTKYRFILLLNVIFPFSNRSTTRRAMDGKELPSIVTSAMYCHIEACWNIGLILKLAFRAFVGYQIEIFLKVSGIEVLELLVILLLVLLLSEQYCRTNAAVFGIKKKCIQQVTSPKHALLVGQ